MNEKASLDYEAKTKDKTVTIEFELWQNPRVVKVPFNVQAGLGLAAADGRPDRARAAGRPTPRPRKSRRSRVRRPSSLPPMASPRSKR